MISLYSGTPGSGKSCHAAREIALRLQRKDSVVIGNFYFNTKAVKKCKGVYLYVPNHRLDPDKLLRFSRRLSKHLGRRLREGEVKIYIDEAQLLFNSREYSSPDRRAWLSFFSQHRHYGYDVILLAQFDRMLDRQIRGLIEYDYIHRKISNAGKIGAVLGFLSRGNMFVCIKKWYPMKQTVDSNFFWAKKSVMKRLAWWKWIISTSSIPIPNTFNISFIPEGTTRKPKLKTSIPRMCNCSPLRIFPSSSTLRSNPSVLLGFRYPPYGTRSISEPPPSE